MTSIEATLLVALGGFIGALIFGGLGAMFDEAKEREATNACMTLAMFGLGTCAISLAKAALMALGV
jgi:hypothetical protein